MTFKQFFWWWILCNLIVLSIREVVSHLAQILLGHQ